MLEKVFELAGDPPSGVNLDMSMLDKCHNLSWMVLSKLAKTRLIYKEHMLPFMSAAANQLSNLFGMTQSERLPTIIKFLSIIIKI